MTAQAPTLEAETKTKPTNERDTRQPRLWNVVILDDDEHTYDYVIRMVRTVFHATEESAFEVAKTVDTHGRAICCTTHKEHAELKRDQCLSFGRDPLIASCRGAMSAVIEPAQGGDDNQDDRE